MPDLLAKLCASYAAATLGSAEARIAAGVTLTVSLCVLALARVPLHGALGVHERPAPSQARLFAEPEP